MSGAPADGLDPRTDRASPAFGVLLRRLRLAAEFSQEQLAERARISLEAVSTLERGTRRAPQRETIARLAEALELAGAQRAGFEAAARAVHGPRPAQPGQTPNNLPLQLTSFVGRETEVVEISELLAKHRLVTIVGAGGIGKTRTALQVGAGFVGQTPDGVWLVELAALVDGSLVAATIATALGIELRGANEPLAAIVAALSAKRVRIVLDNCEHLLADCARAVDAVLRACPQVVILATGRQPLGIAGEQVWRLEPLSVPSPDRIAGLTALAARGYGSVALFVDRAVSADRRFVLSDANAPIVAEVVSRLDGIALAIELAAARVDVLSVKGLSARLRERFRLLAGGSRTALPRQQTLRALIDWSYDLLSEAERALFRRLAIFAGGFTLEMASLLCNALDAGGLDVFDVLAALADKSLVQVDASAEDVRYRLLESMREYAREKLIGCGEFDAAAREHALAYLAFAERLDVDWLTMSDRAWHAQAQPELENWRAALEWALEGRGDELIGMRLTAALSTVWSVLAVAEGRRWTRVGLAAIASGAPPAVIVRLVLCNALLSITLNQFGPALREAERALEGLREVDDPLAKANAQRIAGTALAHLGRVTEAEPRLQEALEIFRAHRARRLVGLTLQSSAVARAAAGDPVEARALYAGALQIFENVGAERWIAIVAANLAESEFRAGDPAAALRHASDGLAIHRARNDTFRVANVQSNMAAYLIALERWDEARAHARDAAIGARAVHYDTTLAFALQHLAAIVMLRPRAEAVHCDDRAAAARLLGWIDVQLHWLEAEREYTEAQEYDAALASARKMFGADRVAELMAEGRSWNEAEAFEHHQGRP